MHKIRLRKYLTARMGKILNPIQFEGPEGVGMVFPQSTSPLPAISEKRDLGQEAM